ncbi:MAG: hypothetical protein B6D64_13155, partial [Bacteroidetes bacterium 4484_276]
GVSEKKAISDPEINAEQRSRPSITTIPIIMGNVRGFKIASDKMNRTSAKGSMSSKILQHLVQYKLL